MIIFDIANDGVAPICEEHAKVHGDEDHNTLEEHRGKRHHEETSFLILLCRWLRLVNVFSKCPFDSWALKTLGHSFLPVTGFTFVGCDGNSPEVQKGPDGANKNLHEGVRRACDHIVALLIRIGSQSGPRKVTDVEGGDTDDEDGGVLPAVPVS